MKISDKIAN